MRKLITANFHRFSKDRFSWCVVGIIVILSLGNVFSSARSFETMAASGYAMSLEDYYFNQAPLIGAFLALLISMFPCYSFLTSHPLLPSPHVHKSILYVCFSIVSLLINSSVPFF